MVLYILRGSTIPRGIYSEVHSPITTPEIICVMAFTLQPMRGCPQHSGETGGAFHSTKNSRNFGFGSEWNRHFPEFHSEILGVPREVGLKFRKIGITGKFRSIRPFLLAPSFSEPGNRTQYGFQFFCSISVFRLLLLYLPTLTPAG